VLLAHHSFAAEFDDKQPIKLTGTLKKVEWTNPHIWYYVEVKNPDGNSSHGRRQAGFLGHVSVADVSARRGARPLERDDLRQQELRAAQARRGAVLRTAHRRPEA